MKNSNLKKLIAVLLAAAFSAAICSACVNLEYEGGKPAVTPEADAGNQGETEAPGTDNCGFYDENLKPGENTDTGDGDGKIHGTLITCGIFADLFVPDSMGYTSGTLVNPDSQDGCCLTDIYDPTKTIVFGTSDDPETDLDEMAETYAADEPQDITFNLGGNTWKGCFMRHNGVDVFLIYTTISGHTVTCRGTGYPLDGELVKTILASVKLG